MTRGGFSLPIAAEWQQLAVLDGTAPRVSTSASASANRPPLNQSTRSTPKKPPFPAMWPKSAQSWAANSPGSWEVASARRESSPCGRTPASSAYVQNRSRSRNRATRSAAAVGLAGALLERVPGARRVRLAGRGHAEHPADVDEVFLRGGAWAAPWPKRAVPAQMVRSGSHPSARPGRGRPATAQMVSTADETRRRCAVRPLGGPPGGVSAGYGTGRACRRTGLHPAERPASACPWPSGSATSGTWPEAPACPMIVIGVPMVQCRCPGICPRPEMRPKNEGSDAR